MVKIVAYDAAGKGLRVAGGKIGGMDRLAEPNGTIFDATGKWNGLDALFRGRAEPVGTDQDGSPHYAITSLWIDRRSDGAAFLDVTELPKSKDDVFSAINRGSDTIIATKYADYVEGAAGHDTIYGNAGNDTLKGGTGADRLYGGEGKDVLDVGADAQVDHIVFVSVDDSRLSTGIDRVVHFQSGKDKVDLTEIDANNDVRDDQAFQFTSGAAKNAVWVVKENGDSILYADVTGDAKADFKVFFDDMAGLVKGDIIL